MLQQTEELQECCSKQKNYRNAATNRRIQECCNKQKNYRNAATNRRTTGMLPITREAK
jgi:hypothetical protein